MFSIFVKIRNYMNYFYIYTRQCSELEKH
uniref:Uncharacterized protein n=1 Tax=Anguilla anguilla TaxID=7936 RepID=A0A0E9UYQ0_ANGAN